MCLLNRSTNRFLPRKTICKHLKVRRAIMQAFMLTDSHLRNHLKKERLNKIYTTKISSWCHVTHPLRAWANRISLFEYHYSGPIFNILTFIYGKSCQNIYLTEENGSLLSSSKSLWSRNKPASLAPHWINFDEYW